MIGAIKTEPYHNQDDRGAWEVMKIMVGEDFYIDIAVREAPGAKQKAAAIAKEVQAALIDSVERFAAGGEK